MNKQGSGKIEWTDYTWNPITGCLAGCEYCYARKIYERFKRSFKPQFHEKRLSQPIKVYKKRIFVCSTSDFFGKGVLPIWREEVYNVMKATDNTYQILTKQPQNIPEEEIDHIPENVWLGVSVTCKKDQWRIKALEEKFAFESTRTFISYEPMIGPLDLFTDTPTSDWFILGAMTGTRKVKVEKDWIDDVVAWKGMMDKPIFMKRSLKAYWPKKLIQQFPKESL